MATAALYEQISGFVPIDEPTIGVTAYELRYKLFQEPFLGGRKLALFQESCELGGKGVVLLIHAHVIKCLRPCIGRLPCGMKVDQHG